jgi:hypothetical protein
MPTTTTSTAPTARNRPSSLNERRARETAPFSWSAVHFKASAAGADNADVTMTISPPIRVFAALGAVVAVALGAWLFLLGRSAEGETAAPPPAHVTQRTPATPTARPGRKPETNSKPRRVRIVRSGFPSAVDRSFRSHRVVVIALYMPGSRVDAVVRREARAGAIASRVGFVDVSASNNLVAGQLLAKTGVLPDPAVVVVRRPGTVVATLGVADRETVEQAVAQAKHS